MNMIDTAILIRKLRRKLPFQAQKGIRRIKFVFSKHPLWDHPEFVRYLNWLEQTQWWTERQFEDYQIGQLTSMVHHAYENVPYYRRIFDQHRLRPGDIKTLSDLQKLPILTKDDVRKNLNELVARNVDRSTLAYRTTSGSTGVPLGVYQDKETSYLHELAYVYRQRRWAGWKFGDPYLVLRGNAPPEEGSEGKPSLHSYNLHNNALFLSSYEMTEENMFLYQKLIEEFKPKFVHGDSSSMEILSRFMKRNVIKNGTIKAIFLGSQTILPHQRKFISETFECPVYCRYGMTEKTTDAVECEKHRGYHVGMEYGVFELLDQENNPISQPGIPGRVAGTGFDTFCMPLIRYATEDVAEFEHEPCSCGRQSTLVTDFKGRLGELIFSKSGYIVPLSPVYASIHGGVVTKLREIKFIQETPGELIVCLILAPGYSRQEVEKELIADIYTKLDAREFKIRTDFVEEIPRGGRGKLGLLDQRLPVKLEHLETFGGNYENRPSAL